MMMCAMERSLRKTQRKTQRASATPCVCLYVCVREESLCVCVCVCVAGIHISSLVIAAAAAKGRQFALPPHVARFVCPSRLKEMFVIIVGTCECFSPWLPLCSCSLLCGSLGMCVRVSRSLLFCNGIYYVSLND